MLSHCRSFAIVSLALSVLAPCGRAGTIDAIYAFGDSLSDVGNAFIATGGTIPGPPYSNGQFSNGPVWLQTLAAGLGLPPLTPSLAGGTDYAVGSAESGNASPADLVPQLAAFHVAHPAADPNALYTLWIGSNDLNAISPGATPMQIAANIATIVGNVDMAINTLAADGAKNLLVVTVPDLGKTPAAIAGGPSAEAAASAVASFFDNTMVFGSAPIPSLSFLAAADGLSLRVLDTFSLVDAIVANPSAFGLTNVTAPCLTGAVNFAGGTPCGTPGQYLFWDDTHPTAAGHAIVGADALQVATAPEPGSISLFAAGLLGLVLFHRRPGR